jgi:hypothetical protein
MRKDKVIYKLVVEDILTVAEDNDIERKFTDTEILKIAERVGDYIGWRDAIFMTINDITREKNLVRDYRSVEKTNNNELHS